MLRLLLLALMGLALASRLALGATLTIGGSEQGANAAGPLGQLQAAMILCHTSHGDEPRPKAPLRPLLSDLLLFDQADNAHALAATPAPARAPASNWYTVDCVAVHAADRPPLWQAIQRARGPPESV
jgi:hypothetical protein